MPCSICKKAGHNKKTCTFLIPSSQTPLESEIAYDKSPAISRTNNTNNVDINEEKSDDILEDKSEDISKETSDNTLEYKPLQKNSNDIENLTIKEELLENEEIFDNIQPKLLVQENHNYHLRDLHSDYIKTTFNIMPKFGDIIQFCKDKAYDTYIIGYNNEFIYAPKYDETGSGNLVIPYEITKYTRNAVELYKNIHLNITKIYVRHDDLFITKIMGPIDKSWNGKIAWICSDNSIEVNFNDVIVNKDVNNHDNDDNDDIHDENKIITIKIDETFNYQKIETIKQNMNKKQISYKCKIDFYENEDCDDTEFIELIKPKLYHSYYYDTNIKLYIEDVFSYEYIIIGPEEDKGLFEKKMHDFYKNKDHKKYIQKINLNVL